jgi:membrane protein
VSSVERASPTDLTVRAWWRALRDAGRTFLDKGMTQRAAALTYFAILSIFPGLIVLVALLGVFGHEGTVAAALRIVEQLGAEQAADALRGPIESAVESTRAAGTALILGAALALWTASGYMGAFIMATNEIYEVDERRPLWKRRPLQLAITLAVVITVALAILALVLTGPVAEAVGAELGVGHVTLTVWSIAKWPFLFVIVAGTVGLLYHVAPNTRQAGLRWVMPGSVLATVLWIAGSGGFALYIANFSSYANTYGGLAGVIIFLIWLWLSNAAILLGSTFAAQLERAGATTSRIEIDERTGPLDGSPPPADAASAGQR